MTDLVSLCSEGIGAEPAIAGKLTVFNLEMAVFGEGVWSRLRLNTVGTMNKFLVTLEASIMEMCIRRVVDQTSMSGIFISF